MKDSETMKRIFSGTCTVLGLGISNLPLVEFLVSHGACVTARDRKSEAELGESAKRLRALGVPLMTGEDYLKNLTGDVLFRSPGLRPDLPELTEAVRCGALLTSETELFLELTEATVLAVTGSDGKTTTTTLTGEMLKAEQTHTGSGRRVYVGGNIGTPLLSHAEEMRPEDYAVLELSSFQLQNLRRSPAYAAITNITPNHLNWHTGMPEYIEAKTNIFRHPGNRRLVLNAENEVTADLAREADTPVTLFSSARASFSELFPKPKPGCRAVFVRDGTVVWSDGTEEREILSTQDILLPGRHNLENYMTAVALTDGTVSPEAVRAVAVHFRGVPHRLERVRTVGGVTYYNSSIDSTPTRTAAALSALTEKPIVICGGYDKHLSFEPLADVLCARAKAVILTGATAPLIRRVLDARTEVKNGELPVYGEPDFRLAVEKARSIARDGDTVLLSPACASFDAFRNFEERGKYFRSIIESF